MNSSNKYGEDSHDQTDKKKTLSNNLDIIKDDETLIAKSQFLNYKKICKIMKDSLSNNQGELYVMLKLN